MNHRLILSLPAAIAALPSFACAQMPGRLEWSIDHGERPSDGKVQFTLMYREGRNQSIHSHPVDLSTLNGLVPDQLSGRRGPVRLRVMEEAGRAPPYHLDDMNAEVAPSTVAAVWGVFRGAAQLAATSGR